MAFQWYFQRRGREFGPYSGAQLKEIAASGRLEPHDMVRRSDRTDAVPAAKIKGLFPQVMPQGRRDASPPPLPTFVQRAPVQAMPTEPPTAHFTSPKPEVRTEARATTDHGDRIERLRVSDTWKRRFRAIEQDPAKFQLNMAAFIFGPFYYALKGLWKKGLLLTLLGVVVCTIIELVARGFGWVLPFGSLWIPASAICGIMANRDVYRKEILGETFWPQLGLIESPGKIVGLAIIVFVITSALSASLSPGPNLPEMGFPEAIPLAESDSPTLSPKEESGPADADGGTATQSPVISTAAVPTANEPAASGKDAGTMMPDFSGVDYGYDFSEDDYQALPDGSTKQTRSGIIGQADLDQIDEGDSSLVGKWADEEGYMDARGRFVRQGRRIVWFDGDRREKYSEVLWLGGKRHGPMVRWRRGGEKAGEVTFVNGELHGPIRHWYEGGQASIQAAFLHGKQHGLRIEWYPNGQKELEVAYTNDLRQGPMRAWYEDGKPKEESLLVDDRYEGLVKVWGSQSRQPDELHYRDGKLHGVVTRHARDGQIFSTATYEDGVLVASNLDVGKTPISELMEKMEAGSVLTQKSRKTFRVIWWEDAWFEMFGNPRSGLGSFKWTYVCSDGVLELVSRPVQEGEGQDGQILVSIYNGTF